MHNCFQEESLGQSEMDIGRLAVRDPYELLMAEAEQAPVGSEGLLFLPYLTGERTPYVDPHARGGWIGLTARHNRQHMVRAILEGVTFGLRDSLELVRDLGGMCGKYMPQAAAHAVRYGGKFRRTYSGPWLRNED